MMRAPATPVMSMSSPRSIIASWSTPERLAQRAQNHVASAKPMQSSVK
jgi:uncharacterized protein (DUF2345 family)